MECCRAFICLSVPTTFFVGIVAPAVAQPDMVATVVVAPIIQQEVGALHKYVGTVTPARSATIGSAVDGRVVEFPIQVGQRVEKGQKLAKLLTDTIALELKAAEAELLLRRHSLEELQNGSRPQEIAQAKARMKAAMHRLEFRVARRERAESLAETPGAISADSLDEAVSGAEEAEELYQEASSAFQLVEAGPRVERIAQAQAQFAIQAALVESLRDRLDKHTIISRFAGYVIAEHTEEGEWLNQGDPVAEVVALDNVEIVAQVVEKHVPFITQGMTVRVEVPALSDRLFEGVVISSAPQADVRARTFPVRVRVSNEINNQVPLLKSGMYSRVAFPIGEAQQALLVPKDAIVLGGAQPMIFVVGESSKGKDIASVTPTPVALGVSVGSLIQIIGNVTPEQKVVVEGNERLRPQQQVRISAVRRSPEAGQDGK